MISLLLQCVSSGVLEPNLQAQVPRPPQSPDVSSDNGFVFIVVSFYLQVFFFVCLFLFSVATEKWLGSLRW